MTYQPTNRQMNDYPSLCPQTHPSNFYVSGKTTTKETVKRSLPDQLFVPYTNSISKLNIHKSAIHAKKQPVKESDIVTCNCE